VFIGIDPGAVSGALGAVDHEGNYLEAFDIEHKDKHILALVFKSRILSSTFTFGRAVGVISAVCELTRYPVHLVTPQKWKKHFHLTADKGESLDMARYLWPESKLRLKKDINKAEALLIAEYLRHTLHGIEKQKTA
jgi:Holliday junction resolvasome RuvABC endonuclease subunit